MKGSERPKRAGKLTGGEAGANDAAALRSEVEALRRRVAELEAREHEGRRTEERLELVVKSAQIGLWYCDLPFKTLDWDAQVKAHFGLAPDAVVTIDVFYDHLHPDDRDRTRLAIEKAIAERSTFDIDYRTVAPDGRVRWIRAIGRVTYDGDRPVRFDGLTVDVTERVRRQEALREADRRKDEFLAILAHELRNPLAPIRQASRIATMPNVNPEQLAWSHRVIERQVQQMSLLLDDLLDISRITRGKLDLRKEPVRLASVLDMAVETARPAIEARRHALTLDLPDEPLRLEGDALRLAQVFSNLLTNAAKYTQPEGKIAVTARREGEDVVVAVTDSGVGIDAEALPRVFEMFAQVHPVLDRAEGGLGIGLALVRGLVALHGGTVAAASEGAGHGSTFTVRLPCGAPEAGDAPPAAGAPGGLPQRVCRILVADDNRDAAQTLAMYLELEGHSVATAYDGIEAFEAAEKFRPHVALLDIGMPRLNGYELAQRIRAEEWGAAATLVAVTGWGQSEDKRRAAEVGFTHHLTKPVSIDALRALLAQACD